MMRVLFACLLVHVVLAEMMPSPWWVPNLTLVGMVLAIGKRPARWLVFSALAGMAAAVWAAQHPGPTLLSYVAVGWAVRMLDAQWDASDARVQLVLIGSASLILTGAALWLAMLWSIPVAGLALIHVAMTCAAFPLARRLSLLRAGVR